MLSVEKLELRTPDGRTLVRELTFHLSAGQALVIQGPNGAGKSTLVRALLGELAPHSGRIRTELTDRDTGYLPQIQNRDCHLPVSLGDVLEISAPSRIDIEHGLSFELLDRQQLGLAWNRASGGERQRTLLTRELMKQPRCLVLDEPLNHLDEASRRRITTALVSLLNPPPGEPAPALIVVSHEDFLAGHDIPAGRIDLVLDGEGGARITARRGDLPEERISGRSTALGLAGRDA